MTARALVVAPQPFFTPRGTPFSVYYRTMVTADLGVGVDLLTYGQGEDVNIPGVRIVRIPRVHFLEPVPIGPSAAKIVLDLLIALWMLGMLLRRRYVFVHAHEEAVVMARFLKPIFRFKLVYDMHSSLPQQLRNFGFTRSRPLIGLFDLLERTAVAHADAVVTISPDLAMHAQRLKPDGTHHELIENSIHTPVRVREGNGNGESIALPEQRRVVVYAGTFEAYQGVALLLNAFATLRRRRDDVHLLMVGGTAAQVIEAQRLARDLGVDDDVQILTSVSQVRAREVTARAEVVVSPRISGSNTPLKIYQILDGTVPLVATRISSHTQVLSDAECFLVEPEPDALAQGIERALTDEQGRTAKVAAARNLYQRRYSRVMYEAKLRRVIEAVAPGAI